MRDESRRRRSLRRENSVETGVRLRYRREILHELLVGISDVEARGYRALADRGATPLVSVATAGGGAKNPDWRAQRSRMLGVPVVEASNGDAAFGAAVLGLRG